VKTILTLRVDGAHKARIAAAARLHGKSITTFMLEATMQHVEATEKIPEAKRTESLRGACPPFFRVLCEIARAGGESNYSVAGYELMRIVRPLVPQENIGDLRRLLRRRADEEDVLDWFRGNLPQCIELVPWRRRGKFLAGVRLGKRYLDVTV
jgi:hypothetical protein